MMRSDGYEMNNHDAAILRATKAGSSDAEAGKPPCSESKKGSMWDVYYLRGYYGYKEMNKEEA